MGILNITELIEKCDRLVTQGKTAEARGILSKLGLARLPRNRILPIARLARRMGDASFGLKLLSRVVRTAELQGVMRSHSAEICEYGVLLQRIGALNEAKQVLKAADPKSAPEVDLFMSYCLFNEWNYAASIPLLRRYCANSALTSYQRFIGQVNLSAALVGIKRYEDARPLLVSTAKELASAGRSRLLGNCYELLGSIDYFLGDLSRARRHLQQAKTILAGGLGHDALYVEKWLAAITSQKEGTSKALESVRKQARMKSDFETVRDCDRLLLRLRFDADRFAHLYFGTPYSCYRERLLEDLGNPPVPSTYVFGSEKALCLDLATGWLDTDHKEILNPGKIPHRTLASLCKDFYRPIRIGDLHIDLFPGEHFNPESSPGRIRQAVKRTRDLLLQSELPLTIETSNLGYSTRFIAELGIRVPKRIGIPSSHDTNLARLRILFSNGDAFSAVAACKSLGISKWAFQALMNWAIETGKAEATGPKNQMRYRLK